MGWIKDRDGFFAGKVDDEGFLYDGSGSYVGRMKGSEIQSRDGSYMGKVNDDGRIYDRSGYYAGRIRDDGWVEDKDGFLQYRL